MFRVTNGTGNDFTGRFNGRDYLFPAAEPVYCEDDAAGHIFGLGTVDKSSVLARHGWTSLSNRYEDGMQILNSFTFEHMVPAYDARLALVEPSAAPQRTPAAATDHGPAPVGQDAPAEVEAATPDPVGAVAAQRRGRSQTDR